MELVLPIIAVRSSSGVELNACSPTNHDKLSGFKKDSSRTCRAMAMSANGKYFAWTNNQTVNVISMTTFASVMQIERPKTNCLQFSPLGNILATWEIYSAKDSPQESANLHLWEVQSGNCIRSFIQKKQTDWCPQWSDDESICARNVNNEVQFYENNNFSSIITKIHLQKVANFSLAHGPLPFHVACYVPGTSGQPSSVRLYQYPNFEGNNAVIASKSFFRADRVDLKWNKKGVGVLIHTSTDVDKTGASYYGEQKLHLILTNGEGSAVQLAKPGPVYTAEWNPTLPEFCVVYGFMPAKATIFNLKCEPLFDFGTGSRNLIYFNSFGNILILAGFGSLRGNVELWDLKRRRLITQLKASDSTYLEWFSDGEHFLTATTSPRLRVGNGYKLWHYTGKMYLEKKWAENEELLEVLWQPHPVDTYQQKQLNYSLTNTQQSEPAQQVYRPPAARGRPSTIKMHENELPSNVKGHDAMSKSALKNKKKRDAKKAKKDLESVGEMEVKSSDGSTHESLPLPKTGVVQDPELAKKIRNLQKKLDQIKKLKDQQKFGKVLELNQLEKIKKEDELLLEMKALQLH